MMLVKNDLRSAEMTLGVRDLAFRRDSMWSKVSVEGGILAPLAVCG